MNRLSKNFLVRIAFGVESFKTELRSGKVYDTSNIKHAPPISIFIIHFRLFKLNYIIY